MNDDRLAQLEELHRNGVLSDAEFDAARARLLPPPPPAYSPPPSYAPPTDYQPAYAPPPIPPGPPATHRGNRRGRGPLIALGGAAILGIAALIYFLGSGSSGTGPGGKSTIAVNGQMVLQDPSGFTSDGTTGDQCDGSGGYNDIDQGAEVVIADDRGTTLTITTLDAGTVQTDGNCQFPFTASVPAGKGYYGITVTHRGTVKFPESDMSAPQLALGSP